MFEGLGWVGQKDARVTAATIARLAATFDAHPTHQLAYHTIVHEVLRHDLVWRPSLAHDGVPAWVVHFVRDAIRAILVTGYFYHTVVDGEGVVADVSEVTPVFEKGAAGFKLAAPMLAADARTGPWEMVALERPYYCHTARRPVVTSGAARAWLATRALAKITDNWEKRDAINATPAVFTTVSDNITAANPGDRMWFKSTANPDVVQTNAVDINRNFSQLVSQRAETIMQLDSLTSRVRGGKRKARHDDPRVEEDEANHAEYAVSDGRTYTQLDPRHGQADTTHVEQGHTNSILFAYGVPPQALGKNINTERLASSNRLTEMAVTGFHSTCNAVRILIGTVLRLRSARKGEHVAFCTVLREHELTELLPYLKTDAAVHHIARCYGVDRAVLDPGRVDASRDVEEHGGAPGGPTGAKGNKKPRTANEAAAATRQRENKPHD